MGYDCIVVTALGICLTDRVGCQWRTYQTILHPLSLEQLRTTLVHGGGFGDV